MGTGTPLDQWRLPLKSSLAAVCASLTTYRILWVESISVVIRWTRPLFWHDVICRPTRHRTNTLLEIRRLRVWFSQAMLSAGRSELRPLQVMSDRRLLPSRCNMLPGSHDLSICLIHRLMSPIFVFVKFCLTLSIHYLTCLWKVPLWLAGVPALRCGVDCSFHVQ